jgi:tetratricopeptide (TPR) repeat protein
MDCPFCRTVNRDEADSCYQCKKDLSMLRLVVNKAKSHFNTALEYAERDRIDEAIAELHNALDLDNTHVNSHVVLGTLYAKKEQLDKAEEQWTEALRLDPRLEKAHTYLDKLRTVRKSLPIVRRQRFYLIAFLGLAVVLATGLLLANRPDPLQTRFSEAAAAYGKHDYRAALLAVGDLAQLPEGNSLTQSLHQLAEVIKAEEAVALQAVALSLDAGNVAAAREQLNLLTGRSPSNDVRSRIAALEAKASEMQMRQTIDAIGGWIASGELTQADARLKELAASQPPPSQEIADQTAQLRTSLTEKAQALLASAMDAYASDRGDREATQRAIATALAVAVEAPGTPAEQGLAEAAKSAQDRLNRLAAEKDRANCLKELDALEARLRKGEIDAPIAAHGLVRLHELFPNSSAPTERLDLLARKEEKRVNDALNEAVASGSIEAAKNTLDVWGKVLAVADPEHASERLALVHDAWLMKQFREAARDSKKAALAVELAPQVLALPSLDETTKDYVQAEVERSRRRQAAARWEWMEVRDDRYEEGRISPEDAETTVRDFDLVNKYLSRKANPKADANIFLYTGVSYLTLGKYDEAIALFDRVPQDDPESKAAKLAKKWHAVAESKKSGTKQ